MQKIVVKASTNLSQDSTVFIAPGALQEIGSLIELDTYTKVFIVTDANSKRHWLDKFMSALPPETDFIELEAGDQQKNIQAVEKIWRTMLNAGCDRKSLVINLGGGVIGDVGGFAASTYMRGVEFINIPTTLLSQVDASVGGKTGFNFAGVKNLIGTFTQPRAVLIDPQLLATLPKREFLSGFAEIIKHGLIADEAYFQQVTAKLPLEFTDEELVDIIATSCRIKAKIIESDINESDQRKLVNFGHTVGHALETLSLESPEPLLHGEAVSIGMAVEADISCREGLLEDRELQTIKQALLKTGLPIQFSNLKIEDVISKMTSDKKNQGGQINFTLLETIGRAVYDRRAPDSTIYEALKSAAI